ncbi:MAG: hypothetical protein ACYC7E_10575 [Armatimonadota bacterium]
MMKTSLQRIHIGLLCLVGMCLALGAQASITYQAADLLQNATLEHGELYLTNTTEGTGLGEIGPLLVYYPEWGTVPNTYTISLPITTAGYYSISMQWLFGPWSREMRHGRYRIYILGSGWAQRVETTLYVGWYGGALTPPYRLDTVPLGIYYLAESQVQIICEFDAPWNYSIRKSMVSKSITLANVDPQDLGEIYCSAAVGHPNYLPTVDVGDALAPLGYQRCAGTDFFAVGQPIIYTFDQNGNRGYNSRVYLPDWCDKTNSLPASEFSYDNFAGYFPFTWKGQGGRPYNGLDHDIGSELSRTFNITIVPSSTVTATMKKIAVCAFRSYALWTPGASTSTVNSITVDGVAYPFTGATLSFPSGSGDFIKARGFLVPVAAGKTIVVNVTVARATTASGIGAWIAFEE